MPGPSFLRWGRLGPLPHPTGSTPSVIPHSIPRAQLVAPGTTVSFSETIPSCASLNSRLPSEDCRSQVRRNRNECLPAETSLFHDIVTPAQNVSSETIGYQLAGSCTPGVLFPVFRKHSR